MISSSHLTSGIQYSSCFIFNSTNEEGTSYTGAHCGLVCNSQTQEALLPEHDTEVAFDVKFDVEDITEVNLFNTIRLVF